MMPIAIPKTNNSQFFTSLTSPLFLSNLKEVSRNLGTTNNEISYRLLGASRINEEQAKEAESDGFHPMKL